jgi:SPX domain protein involved in polyphosphate accumulation
VTVSDTRCEVVGFDPIELAELLAVAALQDRVDRKYVLSAAALTPVLATLAGHARILQIDGRRSFDYESVYFDTPEVTCYRQAALRRRRRFKIRTRTYLNSAERWLEVKTRDQRGHTVKQRREHTHRSEELPQTAREFIDHVVVGAELPGTWELSLHPTLTTTYRRRTLFLPGSASRVTVDTDLRWATATGEHLDLPGLAIVEKTATARPCAADRLLWRAGCRPSLISKYGTGLAALRPDLPSNKWHRVLNRYFWSAS